MPFVQRRQRSRSAGRIRQFFRKDMAPDMDFEGACRKNGVCKSYEN